MQVLCMSRNSVTLVSSLQMSGCNDPKEIQASVRYSHRCITWLEKV